MPPTTLYDLASSVEVPVLDVIGLLLTGLALGLLYVVEWLARRLP